MWLEAICIFTKGILVEKPLLEEFEEDVGSSGIFLCPGMILMKHTYLKVYKCWRILPILKMPTIQCLAILFKKYFNFEGLYIIYTIIWRFLG